MARTQSWNPFAFVPIQVSLITSLTYLALFSVLLWVHHDVPSAPKSTTPRPGLNLTQAWLDLDILSDGFHPVGSARNDHVRSYLMHRIKTILLNNHATFKVVGDVDNLGRDKELTEPADIVIFADNTSNATFLDDWKKDAWTCYGESSNIIVYIRGTEDHEGDWWTEPGRYVGQSGVLVNAHYDSVASGYGATDDGVGVVTTLQLISYFSHEGQRPRRGLVALLNNGEENGLFGAYEYARHPISQLPHVFLNLEGAGAGGRATLFRSTDAEVTRFYASSPHPFGAVVSSDGFKRGLIRSGTDYSVFVDGMGMRGLDLAFYEPRQRYHTNEDDSRNTSPDSVWHMLSASLATVQSMTSHKGEEFEGPNEKSGKLKLLPGTDGVWFDVLGSVLIVLRLQTLFALSVTLLVVGPILFIALQVGLKRNGRWYPFSRRQYLSNSTSEEAVALNGFRGFFRFPIAVTIASVAVGALAFLQVKINPYIVHSSAYAVWMMMVSAWVSIAWFVLAGADRIRPTSLQRFFVLFWQYILTWVLLVFATVGENTLRLASGYFIVIYNATVGLALLISYLELSMLPCKSSYAEQLMSVTTGITDDAQIRPDSQSSHSVLNMSRERGRTGRLHRAVEDETTERTPLLREANPYSHTNLVDRAKRIRNVNDEFDTDVASPFEQAYGDEQPWSSSLPQWTWIIQFLTLVPINVIIVGQVALLAISAMHQTATDGSDVSLVYFLGAVFTALLMMPMTPFLHRVNFRVAILLSAAFAVLLAYNLFAFPFSRDARMKFYFVQRIDLETGRNNVTVLGLEQHLAEIIAELPSSFGQQLRCGMSSQVTREGLQSCSWEGLSPQIVNEQTSKSFANVYRTDEATLQNHYSSWLDYNITSAGSTASFILRGKFTKQCQIQFDRPVSFLHVEDGTEDARFDTVSETGSTRVLLLSRDWDKTFNVTVRWDGEQAKGQMGRAVCMWNDVNEHGRIPAFDEAVRFAPVWSTPVKTSDGLLEGYKNWRV